MRRRRWGWWLLAAGTVAWVLLAITNGFTEVTALIWGKIGILVAPPLAGAALLDLLSPGKRGDDDLPLGITVPNYFWALPAALSAWADFSWVGVLIVYLATLTLFAAASWALLLSGLMLEWSTKVKIGVALASMAFVTFAL